MRDAADLADRFRRPAMPASMASAALAALACPGCRRSCASSKRNLVDTSSWLGPSCSSRETRARSSSCEETRRCVSCFQLLVGDALLADVERGPPAKTAGSRSRQRQRAEQRRRDVCGGLCLDFLCASGDIVEVDSGAVHPAPALSDVPARSTCAEACRPACRWRACSRCSAEINRRSSPSRRLLDHGDALRITHLPKVGADRSGLARVLNWCRGCRRQK